MKTKIFAPILVSLLLLSFVTAVADAQTRPSGGSGTNTSGSSGTGTNTSGSSGTGSNTSGSSGTGSNTEGSSGSGSNAVSINIENPFRGSGTIQELFLAIINNILIPIGSILVVLAFIFAGFKYVMAQGNSTKIEEAHRAFLYSAVGAILILGAWVIATVIETTINQLKT